MDQQETVGAQVSDEDLILLARAGDRTAFGELWSRHARAGISVARKFTSSLDADDLVAEAFTRIYRRVLDGGGPDGAFRPYLYTTIRNLASSWGRDRNDIQIEDIEDLTDANVPEDPATVALDARMTASAFRSLPERWQSVLWYTEVEGMTPQDVAPILGLTANGVAALAYRAREGLRTAWLQAHVSEAGATADCRWVTERLGEHARHSLTPREQDRFDAHLLACERCGLVASEVEDVGSSIAVALLPLILGATVGGAVLATIGTASSASALSLPAVPAAFQAVSAAGASASGIGSAAAIPASVAAGAAATTTAATAPVLVGVLAVTVILGGGVAAVLQPAAASVPPSAHSSEVVTTAPGEDALPTNSPILSSGDGTGQDPVGNLVGTITDPVNTFIPDLPIGPGPVPEHQAPDGIVGALIDLDLNGTGMPGATVSTQVAGQVYATVVAANGTWALHLTALPDGVGPIKLKQNLTVLGIPVPINIPLALLSDTLGITVDLLN